MLIGNQFDASLSARHNRWSVKRRLNRAIVGVLMVPYVALAAVVAPEHLHESDADADHDHAGVHRHLQSHAASSRDRDHTELSADEHVVWFGDSVALYQGAYQFSPPAVPPAARFQLLAAVVERAFPPDYDTAPAHGPPRASPSLRAPPQRLRLI
jgi:hypothetical protein